MRTRKVNRYYCDFCRKGGCAAGHMKRHEERCTMNPNRVCGVCKMTGDGEEVRPLAELIAMLPSEPNLEDGCYPASYIEAVTVAMPLVRNAANSCPACILAALRQAGVPYGLAVFDFKKEMNAILVEFNHSYWEPPLVEPQLDY